MKSAVGYVRVSTKGQAEEDKYGIKAQKAAIEKYAKKNHYEIVEWVEDKVSGASDVRPGFSTILVGKHPCDAVIVYKNDRVARDIKLYFYYLYALEKLDIKLISTIEEFDEGSDMANLYRAMLQFVAEQERKNITIRTTAGRNIKAKSGGYSGGSAPLGYFVLNNELEIDPKEAEIVRRIFQLKKYSLRKIADIINEEGYRTRTRKRFQFCSIGYILKNEDFYRGYYSYADGERVKGKHKPILEKK